MHRFRLVYKIQLSNLNFESYWLVDLNFRAPDWSKFKLFGQIYCRFGRNRKLCSTLFQTTYFGILSTRVDSTETMRAHGYYQEVWPKLAGAAGCKANSESVKFTNKRLDFCQIWLGEHNGPVRLSYILIDSCLYPYNLGLNKQK